MLELRAGTDLTIDKTPYLTSGAVLIQPTGGAVQVAAQAATLIVASGAAQLAVGAPATGLLAKVYAGQAELDIPGNPPAPIAAPRQVILVAETRLPVTALPLHYLDADPWDHQYLSEAEVVSTQLGAAANGFNSQVPPGQGKDAAFYQALLPNLGGQPDFATAFASVQRSQPGGAGAAAKPGDYLIASVIALRGTRGTFESRLNDEMVFSGQGAPWGFVAYDQGVTDLTGVLNDVLGAIGRASLPVGGGPASQIAIGPPATNPPLATTRPPGRTSTPTTTATTTPSNPRQPRPPTTTTTTTAVPLIQLPVPVLPGPLGSLLNPLLDPLIQALNNLLGGHH
jgi:hypothetical protein